MSPSESDSSSYLIISGNTLSNTLPVESPNCFQSDSSGSSDSFYGFPTPRRRSVAFDLVEEIGARLERSRSLFFNLQETHFEITQNLEQSNQIVQLQLTNLIDSLEPVPAAHDHPVQTPHDHPQLQQSQESAEDTPGVRPHLRPRVRINYNTIQYNTIQFIFIVA